MNVDSCIELWAILCLYRDCSLQDVTCAQSFLQPDIFACWQFNDNLLRGLVILLRSGKFFSNLAAISL